MQNNENNENNERLRAEQDRVAAFFLHQRDRADSEEFAKVGEAFTDDILVPSRRSDFYKAVAALENIHCHREVLFRSLYRLHSAITKVPEFPDSKCAASLADDFNRVASELETLNEAMASPIWQEHERKMTTVYAANASFLSVLHSLEVKSSDTAGELNVENDREIPVSDVREVPPWSEMAPELQEQRSWLTRLATRVDLLARMDQDGIFKEKGVPPWLRVLRFFASDEHDRYHEILQLLLDPVTTRQLQWCAEMVKEYRLSPRKDILESYARARCSLYPTVATSGQHFRLVADLLESFDNRTHDAGLVGKNLQNFRDEHPFPYALLESSLRKEHETAQSGTI